MLGKAEMKKLATSVFGAMDKLDTLEGIAVRGYFRGIAQGTITIGQSWPIAILLSGKAGLTKNHAKLLEDVFASGALCEGQVIIERGAARFHSN